jgi:hypothetical protein
LRLPARSCGSEGGEEQCLQFGVVLDGVAEGVCSDVLDDVGRVALGAGAVSFADPFPDGGEYGCGSWGQSEGEGRHFGGEDDRATLGDLGAGGVGIVVGHIVHCGMRRCVAHE